MIWRSASDAWTIDNAIFQENPDSIPQILLSLENKKQFEFVEDRWKTLIFSSLFYFFPQEKVVNYEWLWLAQSNEDNFDISNDLGSFLWFAWLRGCLVYVFKQQFLVFKQHFTHFNALFHPHVFPQMFLNNNFQFLNTHTKQALKVDSLCFCFVKNFKTIP